MQDIASLGFSIDSTQVRSARDELRGLREAGTGAADGVQRLEQSFRAFNPAMQDFGRAVDGATGALQRQSGALDELTRRVAAYAREVALAQAPVRELVESTTRLEALSRAFGATAAAVETFGRTARQVGLDANETVSALQRIQQALSGVTAEGIQARRVLADYGVDLRGAGQGDAARILQQFVGQIRSAGTDRRSAADFEAVLGPLSLDTSQAIQFPGFQSTQQRARSAALSAGSASAAVTRNAAAAQMRANDIWAREFADLDAEYGGAGAGAGPDRGWFESDASYRRRLEGARASGVEAASASGPFSRFFSRLGGSDPQYNANLLEIEAARQAGARENWSPFLPNMRAAGQSISALFGAYTPTNLAPWTPSAPDRTESFQRATLASTFGAAMDPSELARRDAVIGWAGPQGWNLPGDPQFSSLDQIMSGLSEGQRSAVTGRFTAMDWTRNRTAARVSGDAGTVRDAFAAGGAEGGIAGATRSAALAEAELRVRRDYVDATEAAIARTREINDIASRERDIRNRATIALDTETKIIEAGNAAGAQGGSGISQLAAIQGGRFAAAEQLTLGPNATSRANSAFSQALAGVRGTIAQGQVALDQGRAGFAVSGLSGQSYADGTRDLQIQRDLLQVIVAAEGQRGEKAVQARAALAQVTEELRRQRAEQDSLATDRGYDSRSRANWASMSENRDLAAQPNAAGQRMRMGVLDYALNDPQAPADFRRQLQDENGQPIPDARIRARELLNDPQFSVYERQLNDRYFAERQRAGVLRYPAMRAQIDAAGLTSGGDPRARLGLAGRRARIVGDATNDLTGETDLQVAAADAAARAGVTESGQGLTWSANMEGGLDLNMARAMRSGRYGASDLWLLDLSRRVQGEVANAQLPEGMINERGASLFTAGAGSSALGLARSSVGFGRDASEFREQAAAARESGEALTRLTRQQEENRAVAETLARAKQAEAEASRLAAQGATAEAENYKKLGEELRGTVEAYRQRNQERNAGRDAAGIASEGRSIDDQLSDARLESGAGWFRSNASVQSDVARQRFARDLQTRFPGQDTGDMVDRYAELTRLREMNREISLVRDSWVQMGSAAGGALEQVILKGADARQVVSALLADFASAGLRTAGRMGWQWIGDKLSGLVGSGSLLGASKLSTAGKAAAETAVEGFATGGVIHPMAQGELISTMTHRPMANGDTAVMGEAGPEGVFPLVRTSSGQLGIKTSGGGGTVIAPTIHVDARGGAGGSGGASPEQAQRVGEAAYAGMKKAIDEHLLNESRVGGMFNPVFGPR